MISEQEIHPGQIWRRKKNDKLIRIISSRGRDDWYWRGQSYKGSGVSFGSYIRRDCFLVFDPKTGDAPPPPPEIERARQALAGLDREYQSGLGMNTNARAARASLKELLAYIERGQQS